MEKKKEENLKVKLVFDYREPFQAPYMVRELTKKLKLRNAVSGQTIFVAGVSFVMTAFILFSTVGFNHWTLGLSVLIPFGLVELFNRIEPDGKKVHLFIVDYLSYLLAFVIPKKSVYQGKKVEIVKKRISYDRKRVSD
ncbi:MAG: TcpE family conjugal transfer membrane protein, partial [Enterococcus sp.]